MEYIRSPKDDGCIFCEKSESKKDRDNLVLFRGKDAFVLMNLYPYNNAHLMVVPYQHTDTMDTLDSEERLELMDLLQKAIGALHGSCNPHGFNIGMNLGRVAGAGIDEHLHYHIVPRWNGDTNFMPVLGEVKIISQDLLQTKDKIIAEFIKLGLTV